MNMTRTLLSRLLQGLALVLAVVVLNFLLVHAAPGDPVETIAGASGGMSDELKAQLRSQYGLDQPLPVQLGIYLAKIVQGDLGFSYFFNLPVAGLIAERIPATLLLVVSAVLAAFVIGTTLGVLSARKPNGLQPRAAEAIDGERRHPDGAAGPESHVARQVDVGSRSLDHVAHDHVVHLIGTDRAPLECPAGGKDAQLDSVDLLEGPTEIAERRARPPQDDDVLIRGSIRR